MPNEPLTGLNTPNTGDLPGAWGTAALNPNFVAVGGMFAGFATISVSAATTVALTAPSGSLTPGAGPTQQQNAMLRFTGTQLGTATYQFTKPGFYIADNQCTGTSFPIIFAPAAGTGNVIGLPPGKKTQVFFDGTSMDFVSMPDPGTAYDLHGYTSLPAWMNACTVKPYLIKDGTTYSTSSYTALAAILGSTFGGNGVTTFGVPDERNRMRLPVDTNGPGTFSNRVTSSSGINGSTMGAAGGDQMLQAHSHANSLNDIGHVHALNNLVAMVNFGAQTGGASLTAFNGNPGTPTTANTANSTTSITLTNATTGSGAAQNMVPTIVSFLALIKT